MQNHHTQHINSHINATYSAAYAAYLVKAISEISLHSVPVVNITSHRVNKHKWVSAVIPGMARRHVPSPPLQALKVHPSVTESLPSVAVKKVDLQRRLEPTAFLQAAHLLATQQPVDL